MPDSISFNEGLGSFIGPMNCYARILTGLGIIVKKSQKSPVTFRSICLVSGLISRIKLIGAD
jgi:hypothetical protein